MSRLSASSRNLFVGLALTGSVFAQNPKMQDTVTATQEKLYHTCKAKKMSKETQMLISFMSGFEDKKMNRRLIRHGYPGLNIDSTQELKGDSALYQAIVEMNRKYGNPKLKMKRSELLYGSDYRGQFFPIDNIHINPRIYDDKEEMISIRLAELSHVRQYKEKDMMMPIIHQLRILMQHDFRYKELYEIPGTIEHEAHKNIEPKLTLEFAQLYLSKVDTADDDKIFHATELIEYLIDNMKTVGMEPIVIQEMEKLQKGFCERFSATVIIRKGER